MTFKNNVETKNRYAFNISYDGTDENAETHIMFKNFSKPYDGVYIAALRALLDHYMYTHDFKVELDSLRVEIADLRSKVQELESRVDGRPVMRKTFGGV